MIQKPLLLVLEYDPEHHILDIFKYSITWKKVSWCNTIPLERGGISTLNMYSPQSTLLLPWRWVLEISLSLTLRAEGTVWCGLSHTDSREGIWAISHLCTALGAWEESLTIQIMQRSSRPLPTSGPTCGSLLWSGPVDIKDHQAINHLHS